MLTIHVTLDRIKDDRPDHVPDVRLLVDGRPAEVHADLAGMDGVEEVFGTGEGVVDAKAHGEEIA
jgi:hypothetical protein